VETLFFPLNPAGSKPQPAAAAQYSSPHHGLRFWTGAPCSPKRTPDFLSSFLALANFMRLSLMKAAHAGVGGAPCRKSGYMGRKRIFQMLSLHAQDFFAV
jgi:hypothetical protein